MAVQPVSPRYVEASPKTRQLFFLALLLLAGLALLTDRFDEYFPVKGTSEEIFAQLRSRAFYSLIAATCVLLGLSAAAIWLGMWASRTRQWPPAGMRVAFRTKVWELPDPRRVWRLVGSLLFMFAMSFAVCAYGWHAYNQMLQKVAASPKPSKPDCIRVDAK